MARLERFENRLQAGALLAQRLRAENDGAFFRVRVAPEALARLREQLAAVPGQDE